MSQPNARMLHLLHDLGGRYAIPRRKAIDALVEIGADAVPGLIGELSDKNPEVQQAAAEALERIATPEALAALSGWRAQNAGQV
jgi:HEAT repeat protein